MMVTGLAASVLAALPAAAIAAVALNLVDMSPVAPTLEVVQIRTIPAPPAAVWAVIGAFCDLPRWHPRTRACTLFHAEGRTTRTLDVGGIGSLAEVQLDRDDATMTYSYALERGPWPVKQHRATLVVTSHDGGALVTWRATFRLRGISDDGAVADIEDLFRSGLAGLARETTR